MNKRPKNKIILIVVFSIAILLSLFYLVSLKQRLHDSESDPLIEVSEDEMPSAAVSESEKDRNDTSEKGEMIDADIVVSHEHDPVSPWDQDEPSDLPALFDDGNDADVIEDNGFVNENVPSENEETDPGSGTTEDDGPISVELPDVPIH